MTDTDRVNHLARLVARHGAITLRAGRKSPACTAEDEVLLELRKEHSEYMKRNSWRNSWVEREEHLKVLNAKAELERKHIALMEIADKRMAIIEKFRLALHEAK